LLTNPGGIQVMRAAAAIAGLVFLAGAPAWAQSDARNQMGVPASTIFKSMLRFAASGDASKVEKSLDLLKPVLGEHEAAFGAASAGAVVDRIRKSKSEKSVLTAVRELVARDAAVLLRPVATAPLDRARTLSRTSVLEWRIVEDDVRQADARRADEVEAAFHALFESIETRDETQIHAASARVEKELLALFAK
jgi:hypothetical protein